mgnify:CR=1 FL=1
MKPVRENNILLLKGINPAFVIKEGKSMLDLLKNRNKNKEEADAN